MRVSDITSKTDISEFLLLENVEQYINSLSNSAKTIESEITGVFDTEIVSGGLDVYSLNINGESPAHDLAVELVNNLCIVVDELSEASNGIDKKAKEHRYDELTRLKDMLTKRINKIQNDISRIERVMENNVALINNYYGKMAIYDQELANGSLVTYTSVDYQNFSNSIGRCTNENTRLSSERDELVNELDGGFWEGHKGGLCAKLENVNIELSTLEAKM